MANAELVAQLGQRLDCGDQRPQDLLRRLASFRALRNRIRLQRKQIGNMPVELRDVFPLPVCYA